MREQELKERLIRDLNDFYEQLTDTEGMFKDLDGSYPLFDIWGSFSEDSIGAITSMFLSLKNCKKVIVFSTLFSDEFNKENFKKLVKVLKNRR